MLLSSLLLSLHHSELLSPYACGEDKTGESLQSCLLAFWEDLGTALSYQRFNKLEVVHACAEVITRKC